MKITPIPHRTDPLSGKEPEAEPWCGADRAVVNLAWHDIQLVELVPAFCSSFGASHFPICISGPEPDVRRELHGQRTASPGSHGHRTQPFHTELLVPSCSPAATKLAALHRPHSSKFRHDFRICVRVQKNHRPAEPGHSNVGASTFRRRWVSYRHTGHGSAVARYAFTANVIQCVIT